MDSINTRLKKIRKSEGMNQKEFGDKIFLSQYQISLLENGQRTLTDRVIESICSTFKVNPTWFRQGEGEMYIDSLKDSQYSDEIKQVTKDIFELDPEDRAAILLLIATFKNKKR